MGRENGIDFVALFDRTDYSDVVAISTDDRPRFDDLFETDTHPRQSECTERYMVFNNANKRDAIQAACDRTRTYEDWTFLGVVQVLRGDVSAADLNDDIESSLVNGFKWLDGVVKAQPAQDESEA